MIRKPRSVNPSELAALPPRAGASTEVRTTVVEGGAAHPRFDVVATEEPLEIRVRTRSERRTVAITLRTPGSDFELAAGFLANEGLLRSRDDLAGISYCVDADVDVAQRYNIVNVDLTAPTLPHLETLDRHFLTSSACGICGAASIAALADRGLAPVESAIRVTPAMIVALPDALRAAQGVFATTGGLHAAGLFAADGSRVAVREDVGRHNAVDKLIGFTLLEQRASADRILMVSGRTSYEIVQKAVSARIPVVCAVSAPSSLAVDLARAFGVTLVGFVRGDRFNIYTHPERVVAS
jgi:FdhD protein